MPSTSDAKTVAASAYRLRDDIDWSSGRARNGAGENSNAHNNDRLQWPGGG